MPPAATELRKRGSTLELTSVDAKYSIVDHDGQGEEVKHVGEVGPDVRGAVFSDAFCVEPVRLVYEVRHACNATREQRKFSGFQITQSKGERGTGKAEGASGKQVY